MNLATKTLNKQRRTSFSLILKGLAFGAVATFGGFGVLKNGIGVAPAENSKGAVLYNFLKWLMSLGINAENIIPYCFAGFFFILAAYGLYVTIRGIFLMFPSNTPLGKSIKTQKKGYEGFGDVIESINVDLNRSCQTYGDVNIGSEWILAAEAMRLPQIRGVFSIDAGRNDYVLCLVDDAQNIWATSLEQVKHRNAAAKYLKSSFPNVATGDNDAYMAFLKGELITAYDKELASDERSYGKELFLPADTSFSFVRANGVPTSNFTNDEVLSAFRAMSVSQSISLSIFNPTICVDDIKVSEIIFSRPGSGQWEMALLCEKKDGRYRAAKGSLGENEAESLLEKLLSQKQLPNFVEWRAEEIE